MNYDGGKSLIVSYGCFGSLCSLITIDALDFVCKFEGKGVKGL